jgi:signal peptidase II
MLKGVIGGERVWWLVAAIVIVVDQATKWLARELLEGRAAVVVAPFFNLVFHTNRGAAFSFLAGESGWQRWFFAGIAVAAVVLISMLIRRHASERLFCVGLALILGGAVGNLVDRILRGYVIDFVQLHAQSWFPTLPPFPTFNVADSAITVGAVIVLFDSLRRRPSQSAQRS